MGDTNLRSKIERGGDEEQTQAYCQYVETPARGYPDEETTKLYR